MSEANKQLVRDYFDAIREGDLERVGSMMHADLRFWVSGGEGGDVVFPSPEELLVDIRHSLTDLYDPEVGLDPRIDVLTAEGDRVVAELRIHSRSLHTKADYDNWYVFVFVVRDGRFAEIREYLDTDYVRNKLLVPAGIATATRMPWLGSKDRA